MKTFFLSVVSLVVGLVIGGYIGYRYYDRHISNEAVQQMLDGTESADRLEAARSIRAIELIQTGNTRQAVEMFSFPIADFYSSHVNLKHNDGRTQELLARIGEFARTIQVVAAEIKREMDNEVTKAGVR